MPRPANAIVPGSGTGTATMRFAVAPEARMAAVSSGGLPGAKLVMSPVAPGFGSAATSWTLPTDLPVNTNVPIRTRFVSPKSAGKTPGPGLPAFARNLPLASRALVGAVGNGSRNDDGKSNKVRPGRALAPDAG